MVGNFSNPQRIFKNVCEVEVFIMGCYITLGNESKELGFVETESRICFVRFQYSTS